MKLIFPLIGPAFAVFYLIGLFSPLFYFSAIETDIEQAYQQQAAKQKKAIEALGDPTTRMTMNAWQSRAAACMNGQKGRKHSGLMEARAEMGKAIVEGTLWGASEEALPKLITLAEQKCAKRILGDLAFTNPSSLPPLLGEILATGYALPPAMVPLAKRSPEPLMAVKF